MSNNLISIVVPCHNEEAAIGPFCTTLCAVLESLPDYRFEILFINDGSTDNTQTQLEALAAQDSRVRVIEFSRNFGKEAATTAGLHEARGDAVLAMDADLQHPPALIPDFLKKWRAGADVIIGVRNNNASDSKVKKLGSALYYKLMNAMSETKLIPRATDFRLLDRSVLEEFKKLTEHNRMTRGLIDWLGFKRDLVHFDAPEREYGQAAYSFWKLVKLAGESFISHSLLPLRLTGYLGVVITLGAGLLGAVMFIDRYLYPWGLDFSGTAILANITLFLIGIVLIALGLLSFYIAHIYHETQGRPLYVIRKRHNK
jgi:glycosyltransferase involved in cell wall biosynthesis